VRKSKRSPPRFVQISLAVDADGSEHIFALDILGRVWFYDHGGATWRWLPSTRETLPVGDIRP